MCTSWNQSRKIAINASGRVEGPTAPRAGCKNLNIVARASKDSPDLCLGLDTHADVSFIKSSLVPRSVVIRPASVAVRGVGTARAIGWAELEMWLKPQDLKPLTEWKHFTGIFLVMPDTAIPRDALVSYGTMMDKLQIVLDARRSDRVPLLGEDFKLLPSADTQAGVTGAAMVVSATPASLLFEPLIACDGARASEGRGTRGPQGDD